jgi:hypothetical protein
VAQAVDIHGGGLREIKGLNEGDTKTEAKVCDWCLISDIILHGLWPFNRAGAAVDQEFLQNRRLKIRQPQRAIIDKGLTWDSRFQRRHILCLLADDV